MNKIETNFYEKYVGDYAKRFYTPFEKERMAKIIGFKIYDGEAYIQLEHNGKKWWWDMDDSVIVTNKPLTKNITRVANVNHKQYKGYNPFNEVTPL